MTSEKPLVVSIDDEANILKLVRLVLEPAYQVLTFTNAEEALSTVRTLRPDVIICDINMPKVDGFELHTLLRDSDTLRSVPFIYLTALADRETFRKGMLQGADDYLVKPFSPDELREAVKARLERTHTLRSEPPSELWTITSLGGVAVIADGKVRDFHENKKGLELFLYLLRHQQHMLQTEVVQDLWWESVFMNTLHRLLSRARKTFEGLAEFEVHDDIIFVKVLRPFQWDAEDFERSAKQALASRDEAALEQAQGLYKGDFLVDFNSPWSDQWREHYEELYVEVLETSVEVASNETLRKNALKQLQSYIGTAEND